MKLIHLSENYLGNCKNSFDEDGECIIPDLQFTNVSDFAHAEENAEEIGPEEFEKHCGAYTNISIRSPIYLHHNGLYMAYDPDKDIHYFFSPNLNEGTPHVAEIPPQKPGLVRCTAISCNAILKHFKKNPISSAAEVPKNAAEAFKVLKQRGLKVQPNAEDLKEKKITLQAFVNSHRQGVFYVGTPNHAIALIDGEVYDSDKGKIDARLVIIYAQVTI